MNDLEKETMRTLEEQVAALSKLVKRLVVYNSKLTDQIVKMSNDSLGIVREWNTPEEDEAWKDL